MRRRTDDDGEKATSSTNISIGGRRRGKKLPLPNFFEGRERGRERGKFSRDPSPLPAPLPCTPEKISFSPPFFAESFLTYFFTSPLPRFLLLRCLSFSDGGGGDAIVSSSSDVCPHLLCSRSVGMRDPCSFCGMAEMNEKSHTLASPDFPHFNHKPHFSLSLSLPPSHAIDLKRRRRLWMRRPPKPKKILFSSEMNACFLLLLSSHHTTHTQCMHPILLDDYGRRVPPSFPFSASALLWHRLVQTGITFFL